MNISSSEWYTGIHITDELTPGEIRYIKGQKCSILPQLDITRRIGSPGEEASIYSAILPEFEAKLAIKVFNRPNREPEFALYLTEQYPMNFLNAYFADRCLFNGKSEAIMVMELAISDLSQYIRDVDFTEREMNLFIDQVIQSVEILARNGIHHNDLHVRNVFIVSRGGKRRAVIGDFGKSLRGSSYGFYLDDLMKFFSRLIKEPKLAGYPRLLDRIGRLHAMSKDMYLKTDEIEELTEREFISKIRGDFIEFREM